MSRFTPASLAAWSRFNVPVALIRWEVRGSSTDLCTDPRAARWKTKEVPSQAARQVGMSEISPRTNSARSPRRIRCRPLPGISAPGKELPAASSRFFTFPVLRSSRTLTRKLSRRRAWAR